MDWRDTRSTRSSVAPCQKRQIGSFRGEQLHPQEFLKFVTHKEDVVLCLHPLFNVTLQEGKSLQLFTSAECTVACVNELRRDDNFLQHNTIEENFFANLCESFKGTQWAIVEESGAVISVPMRLTSTRVLQFSQARGPILWK